MPLTEKLVDETLMFPGELWVADEWAAWHLVAHDINAGQGNAIAAARLQIVYVSA